MGMKAAGAMGKVGFSKAMSAGWIILDKSGGKPVVNRKVGEIEDVIQKHLVKVQNGDGENIPEKEKVEYKKRKLVQEVTEKIYTLNKGSNFSTTISKAETELTPEMISSGAWKTANFKPYNFDAL